MRQEFQFNFCHPPSYLTKQSELIISSQTSKEVFIKKGDKTIKTSN